MFTPDMREAMMGELLRRKRGRMLPSPMPRGVPSWLANMTVGQLLSALRGGMMPPAAQAHIPPVALPPQAGGGFPGIPDVAGPPDVEPPVDPDPLPEAGHS